MITVRGGLGDTLPLPPPATAVSMSSNCQQQGISYNPSMDKASEMLKVIFGLPLIPFSGMFQGAGLAAGAIAFPIGLVAWAAIGYFAFGKSVTAAVAVPAAIGGGFLLTGHLAHSECQPYVPPTLPQIVLPPVQSAGSPTTSN